MNCSLIYLMCTLPVEIAENLKLGNVGQVVGSRKMCYVPVPRVCKVLHQDDYCIICSSVVDELFIDLPDVHSSSRNCRKLETGKCRPGGGLSENVLRAGAA